MSSNRTGATRPLPIGAIRAQAQRAPAFGNGAAPVEPGREAARAFFSELAGKFPAFDSRRGGFTTLAIPNGTVVPAGSAGWYGLVDFDPSTINQDVVFFGFWFDALSCNPSVANAGTDAAWGDQYGYGAGLVVGLNLPTVGADGTWVSSPPPPIIGLDSTTAAVRNAGSAGSMICRTFPSGKYTTGWNKRGLPGSVVPFVRRVPQGTRLGAAFVLNRTQVNAGANKNILGGVEIELYFGLTKNPVEQFE